MNNNVKQTPFLWALILSTLLWWTAQFYFCKTIKNLELNYSMNL